MAETRKEKNLKLASWLILTLVPSIFAVLLIFFNWGFDAKGYVSRIEKMEEKTIQIVPKIEKLEVENSLFKLATTYSDLKVKETDDKVNQILVQLDSLNKNVAFLNYNIDDILKEKDYKIKEDDWNSIVKKLDKLLERNK